MDDLYEFLAAAIFLVFVAMFVLSFASIGVRVGRYKMRNRAAPVLLYRDLITFGGLSITFFSVATARAMNLPPEYTRTVHWLIFTSAPALVGMGTFLYFEWFVIGHWTEPTRRSEEEQQNG